MEGKQVRAEELKQVLAAVMNAAHDGRIIADTEEPVREAPGVFRERVYAQAMMALACLSHSGLWDTYWKAERAAA